MKILVLGGSGLIGKSILKKGCKEFEMIGTFDNSKINIDGVKSIQIHLFEDFEKLQEFIISEKPEIIINSLSISNVEFCELNQNLANVINFQLTEKICTISSKINSRFILISTDYVFDGTVGNYTEKDEPNPVNYYGYTKLLAEKSTLKNQNNLVIRTTIVYDWDPKVRFLNFVYNNLKEEKPFYAYNDTFSCPTLLADLTDAILKISLSRNSGIFHAVGSSCVTRFEFARLIAKKFGFNENLINPQSIIDAKLKAKHPLTTCLNNSKMMKMLDINFKTIEEGLEQVLLQSKMKN